MENIKRLIDSRGEDIVKGDNGIILVIGGSRYYTGAPYFVASASFMTGADVVYIFSQKEAIHTIKILLPEAIVMEIGYHEWVLKRISACAIGSGLGDLDEETLKIVISIVDYFKIKDIPLVIDGEGLKYYNEKIFKDYRTLLLTPNYNEMKKTRWIKEEHCLIEKGKNDIIRLGEKSIIVTEEGSKKRCCCQGDMLVGILCTFLSWISGEKSVDIILNVAECGCILIRIASNRAYSKKYISLLSSDILKELSNVIIDVGNVTL